MSRNGPLGSIGARFCRRAGIASGPVSMSATTSSAPRMCAPRRIGNKWNYVRLAATQDLLSCRSSVGPLTREMDQLRNRFHAELLQDVAAMHFDRSVTDAKRSGDGLARQALDDQRHHLALAIGQGCKPLGESVVCFDRSPGAEVTLQRIVDAVKQLLIPIRFLNEVNRAGFDGLDGNWNVAVSTDEHDWYPCAHRSQFLLQHRPAHMRHADIEHQTARTMGIVAIKEFTRRAKRRRGQPDRSDQLGDRVAHRFIIVNDEDRRFVHCSTFSSAIGNVNWNTEPPSGLSE